MQENKWIELHESKITSNTSLEVQIAKNKSFFRKHMGLCVLMANIDFHINSDDNDDELEELKIIFPELQKYNFDPVRTFITIQKTDRNSIDSFINAVCTIENDSIKIESYSLEAKCKYKMCINLTLKADDL